MNFLILAGCIAVASALPALLGSDHCTYGPSYWCSHVQHARECGAMKHCMSTAWKYDSQPVKSDAKCEVCVFGVTEARKLLKEHATQEQITEFLEKGCELVPDQKLRDECLNITKEYLPEILQLLASDMDPKVVCTVIGMCTQDLAEPMSNDVETTTKAPSALCDDCQKFFEDVEKMLKDNATEGQIEAALDTLCKQLGPLEDECKTLIAQYVPVLLDLLSTEFNPGVACRMLGLCQSGNVKDAIEFRVKLLTLIKQLPMTNNIRSPVGCEICTEVMEELRLMDRDAKTQQAIENFLYENVCNRFGQFKTQCQDLVRDYAPMLFEYLANELDPSVACKALHMCTQVSAPKSRVTSLTVVKAEPTLFKTKLPPKMTKPVGSAGCVLCEFVLKEIDAVLSQNSSRAEVTAALEAVCSRLPDTIAAECKSFVDQYAAVVIELLVSDLDPARVCQALGLCSRQIRLSAVHLKTKNTEFCQVCQLVVQYLETLLKGNETEEEIKHLLEKICNFLPETLKDQCDDLVKQYIDVLLKLVIQMADPLKVCESIGVCGNTTVAHPAVKQLNSLLQQAKTDNTLYYMDSGVLVECVQGPDVWCKDQSTAEKCGAHAVAYCRRHIWTR